MSNDPWQHTKDLLGADFFDTFEPTEDEMRDAFEAELEISHAEDRPFSVLGFLSGLRGSGLEEIGPGTYLAHKVTRGGWLSGTC